MNPRDIEGFHTSGREGTSVRLFIRLGQIQFGFTVRDRSIRRISSIDNKYIDDEKQPSSLDRNPRSNMTSPVEIREEDRRAGVSGNVLTHCSLTIQISGASLFKHRLESRLDKKSERNSNQERVHCRCR